MGLQLVLHLDPLHTDKTCWHLWGGGVWVGMELRLESTHRGGDGALACADTIAALSFKRMRESMEFLEVGHVGCIWWEVLVLHPKPLRTNRRHRRLSGVGRGRRSER
jgi:hypothetical protein